MRLFPFAAWLLLALAGCAGTTDEVLPVARSVKGASFVRTIDVIVRPTAAGSVGALDERAKQRSTTGGGDAGLAFEQMLRRMIEEATREAGLTSGRALRLLVEVDTLQVANAGTAFFGADDRLAGSVFIKDAKSGEELGQLYLNVGSTNGGMLSVLARGGGVRERLAESFGRRIAKALGGREPRR